MSKKQQQIVIAYPVRGAGNDPNIFWGVGGGGRGGDGLVFLSKFMYSFSTQNHINLIDITVTKLISLIATHSYLSIDVKISKHRCFYPKIYPKIQEASLCICST